MVRKKPNTHFICFKTISLLLTLFQILSFEAFGQDNHFVTDSKDEISAVFNRSTASRWILKKCQGKINPFDAFGNRSKIISSIKADRIILNSNDVILYGEDIGASKLVFTGLYFNARGKIEEIRYFYYGGSNQVSKEYHFIKREFCEKYGKVVLSNQFTNNLESAWFVDENQLDLILKTKSSNEGSAVFLIFKKAKGKEREFKMVLKEKAENIIGPDYLTKSGEKESVITLQKENSKNKEFEKIALLSYKQIHTKVQKNQDRKNHPASVVITQYKPLNLPKNGDNDSIQRTNKRYSVSRSTSMRTQGNDEASLVIRVRPHNEFVVLDMESNEFWAKVKFENNLGWVKKSVLQKL